MDAVPARSTRKRWVELVNTQPPRRAQSGAVGGTRGVLRAIQNPETRLRATSSQAGGLEAGDVRRQEGKAVAWLPI